MNASRLPPCPVNFKRSQSNGKAHGGCSLREGWAVCHFAHALDRRKPMLAAKCATACLKPLSSAMALPERSSLWTHAADTLMFWLIEQEQKKERKNAAPTTDNKVPVSSSHQQRNQLCILSISNANKWNQNTDYCGSSSDSKEGCNFHQVIYHVMPQSRKYTFAAPTHGHHHKFCPDRFITDVTQIKRQQLSGLERDRFYCKINLPDTTESFSNNAE